LLHADRQPSREVSSDRVERQRRRVEHAAHLKQLRGARMPRLGHGQWQLVVVESTHSRASSSFSEKVGVFPEETDRPSILFPSSTSKFPFVFNNLAFPDAI